jgi:crotonobetainyl-CoA:carnitine CoA-transferase CaiB-like acyl-CoA transferase
MDTVFMQMATEYLRESLMPGTLLAAGNSDEFDAPSGVYRCAGEDGYCAVSIDGERDWALLAAAIERPDLADNLAYDHAAGRVAGREVLDTALGQWLMQRTPAQAQDTLQGLGIAAGAATHVGDLLTDPHLAARHQLATLVQPGHDKPFVAPLLGADTREICREILAMSDGAIDALIDADVLAVPEVPG